MVTRHLRGPDRPDYAGLHLRQVAASATVLMVETAQINENNGGVNNYEGPVAGDDDYRWKTHRKTLGNSSCRRDFLHIFRRTSGLAAARPDPRRSRQCEEPIDGG